MIEQHSSLSEKFLKKGFWLYFFSFLIAPLGYIVKMLISNDLSVGEMGVLYGILSLVTLLSSYNDLGLAESLNYFLPKYIVEKDWNKFKTTIFYAFFAQFISGIIIGIVLIIFSSSIATYFFHSVQAISILKILSLFFFGFTFFHIMSVIYMATQNTKIQKLVEFIRMVFVVIFTFGFWFLDLGTLENYAWTWVIGVFIGTIFSFIHFYQKYYKPYLADAKIIYDKNMTKELFKYAFMVLIASNIGTVLSQVDMLLISYLLGPIDAGYYTTYLSIINIPFMLIGPIIGFLFPVFSELNSLGEHDKIKVIKSIFYKYFAVMSVIISVFFFIFSSEIAYTLFGEKFRFSGEILKYSCFFITFNFLFQIDFCILAGIGKVKERAKILAVGLVFNVILNLILINLLGVVGSSLAVGLSWIPIFIMSEIKTKAFRTSFDFKFFIKNVLLSGILGFFIYEFLL
ncbi:MAG: oligosaccharide flippase family protein, partial [Candidatus Gracilibacteria bacterium]|nr:oligosaccharide flippase family protein [Candidatus Gracilibacteria bacterium]